MTPDADHPGVPAAAGRPSGSGSRRSPAAPWRLATRLARREVVRRPLRTLLVAILIAVPVAAMTMAAVWVRTDPPTADEAWRQLFGTADAVVSTPARATPVSGADTDTTAAESNPAVAAVALRTVSYHRDFPGIRAVGGRRIDVQVNDPPLTDPLAAPTVVLLEGKRPTAPGEVLLSPDVAERLGVGPGDTVQLDRPEPLTWQVVGIGRSAAQWTQPVVYLAPRTPFPWQDENPLTTLVDLRDDASPQAVAGLPESTMLRTNAAQLIGDGTNQGHDIAWSWVIGALVLVVAGIVITAAFAATARRQLVMVGQLAANGAPPSVLRRVLFLQGTLAGAVGTGVGLALGAGGLAVVAPYRSRLADHLVEHYSYHLTDFLPIVALGVATATVAALIPARTNARVPVLSALAGRRPLHPVPRYLTALGLVSVLGGLGLFALATLGSTSVQQSARSGDVWALTAVLGGIAVLLGACAASPGYVSVLEPVGDRMRGSARLATRSLARHRTRTAAVVSGVGAAAALAVAASGITLSIDAHDAHDRFQVQRSDEIQLNGLMDILSGVGSSRVAVPDATVNEVLALIPGAVAHRPAVATPPGGPGLAQWRLADFTPGPGNDSQFQEEIPYIASFATDGSVTIADDAFLALYDPPASVRDALRDDGAVVLTDGTGRGTAGLERVSGAPGPEATTLTLSLEVLRFDVVRLGQLPPIVVTPEKAQELGFTPTVSPVVIRSPHDLTADQRSAVLDLQTDLQDRADNLLNLGDTTTPHLNVNIYQPSRRLPTGTVDAVLAAFALLACLLVVAASLALAAAETRDERDVLLAVGARPSTMRHTSGYRALVLSALGTAMAVPIGLLPVWVWSATNRSFWFVFPWRVTLLLLLAVPLIAGAVTVAASGLGLRLRPARMSAFQFD